MYVCRYMVYIHIKKVTERRTARRPKSLMGKETETEERKREREKRKGFSFFFFF